MSKKKKVVSFVNRLRKELKHFSTHFAKHPMIGQRNQMSSFCEDSHLLIMFSDVAIIGFIHIICSLLSFIFDVLTHK